MLVLSIRFELILFIIIFHVVFDGLTSFLSDCRVRWKQIQCEFLNFPLLCLICSLKSGPLLHCPHYLGRD